MFKTGTKVFKDGIFKAIFDTGKSVVTGTQTVSGVTNGFKLFGNELVVSRNLKNVYSCLAGILVLVINPKEIISVLMYKYVYQSTICNSKYWKYCKSSIFEND